MISEIINEWEEECNIDELKENNPNLAALIQTFFQGLDSLNNHVSLSVSSGWGGGGRLATMTAFNNAKQMETFHKVIGYYPVADIATNVNSLEQNLAVIFMADNINWECVEQFVNDICYLLAANMPEFQILLTNKVVEKDKLIDLILNLLWKTIHQWQVLFFKQLRNVGQIKLAIFNILQKYDTYQLTDKLIENLYTVITNLSLSEQLHINALERLYTLQANTERFNSLLTTVAINENYRDSLRAKAFAYLLGQPEQIQQALVLLHQVLKAPSVAKQEPRSFAEDIDINYLIDLGLVKANKLSSKAGLDIILQQLDINVVTINEINKFLYEIFADEIYDQQDHLAAITYLSKQPAQKKNAEMTELVYRAILDKSHLDIRKLAANYLAGKGEHALLMSITLKLAPNDKLYPHLSRIFVDRLKSNKLINANENIVPTDNFIEALYLLLNIDDARSDYYAREVGNNQQSCIDAAYYLFHYPHQHERLMKTFKMIMFEAKNQYSYFHEKSMNINEDIRARLILLLIQYVPPTIELNEFLYQCLGCQNKTFFSVAVRIYAFIYLVKQTKQPAYFLKIENEILSTNNTMLTKFLLDLREIKSFTSEHDDINNCLRNILNNPSCGAHIRQIVFVYLFQQSNQQDFIKHFLEQKIFTQCNSYFFSFILDYLCLNNQEYLVILLNDFLLKENVDIQFERGFLVSICRYYHGHDVTVLWRKYNYSLSAALKDVLAKLEQRRESKYKKKPTAKPNQQPV
ncbi:MAG: hypothetical protein ACK4PR_10340, partial [Gammaproteobacteria bacterium]